MLFHNILHFIALMVPQGTTQILPAVEDTKIADAENDTVPHIIQRRKKERKNPRQNPQ